MVECTIQGCKQKGIQRYDLFSDKPRFIQSLLCKKHSKEADKELLKRSLKVNEDGTYRKIKK